MKLYLSYRSLSANAGGDPKEKSRFFNEHFFAVFQMWPPYIGVLLVMILVLIAQPLVQDLPFIMQAFLVGAPSGFLYLQCHCIALDKIAEQQAKKNRTR